MRAHFLALLMASTLASPLAFAEPAGAPCNVVDQEALDALTLGDYKMSAEQSTTERKQIPENSSGLPPTTAYACTYTPKDGFSPALIVTTTALPQGGQPIKPACEHKRLPVGSDKATPDGMGMSMCTATAKNNFLSFILITNAASDAATASVFPAQIERLFNGLVAADQ